jgi:hypothetical protein
MTSEELKTMASKNLKERIRLPDSFDDYIKTALECSKFCEKLSAGGKENLEDCLKEVVEESKAAIIKSHNRFLSGQDAMKRESYYKSLSRMLSYTGSSLNYEDPVYDRKMMQLVRAPKPRRMSPEAQKHFISLEAFDADLYGQEIAISARVIDSDLVYYFFPVRAEYVGILMEQSGLPDIAETFFRLANDMLSEFSSLASVRGNFVI